MQTKAAPAPSLSGKRPFLAWLYAPSPAAFIFALRTTVAACLALGIAFWMELDSPAWSAMTVWSVAQLSRGESLSKARWRIVGTFIGACAAISFMGICPQAPWLFFPLIALWIGLCCGLATFVSNFRSYAMVLAGYTCTIICMSAAPDGNRVFMLAVSRGTYILLGVLCESFVGFLFAFNQERAAHLQLRRKLESGLLLVSQTLANILGRRHEALTAARNQFDTILKINDQIEFAEVEMGAHGREGDHARAALSAVSALLSRGFGMATRLQLLTHHHPDYQTASDEIVTFLHDLPQRLSQENTVPDLLAELQHLRDICRQYAAPHRLQQVTDINKPSQLTPEEVDDVTAREEAYITRSELDERILFVSLGELLGDLEQAISEYQASTHSIRGDHFTFRRRAHRDTRLAINNGIRGILAVLIAALIYEITAWPQGFAFVEFTSLVCALYATQENPVLGTTNFLKGTLASVGVAWVLVFILIPMIKTYEPLVIVLGGAMMLGGLARANPSTAGGASAYGLLMPAMLGLQNHHVMNEMTFYNNNLAIVLGTTLSVMVFRSILPFNSRDERFRLRRLMLKELRSLASPSHVPQISAWIGHSTDRFARILRHSGPEKTPAVEAAIQGTLATLTLGLNIIRLRSVMDREYLPESARRPIVLVLQYIEMSTHRHGRAARVSRAAIRRLRVIDTQEEDIITRLEITRAITYLVVIAYTLETNENFLDEKKLFTGEKHHPPLKAA
ncbi:FUSC family protein [Saccharibacter sp. 17.LH.SD]|uniref:FUSC family protein n=1 Tax=Saccharibacter sp. 17.LH.SD TaxID=2689393 RepID=UPI001F3422A9|nr:FUSC family protein [Saccharibacter sp. 17.LH.SD]